MGKPEEKRQVVCEAFFYLKNLKFTCLVKTTSILKCSVYCQTERFLTACISLLHEPDKPWSSQSRLVRTHEKNSGDAVRRLDTIIQSIFCAQSGASNRLTVWKWSGESRYPGAFPPVLENFCRAFSPGPTDRPWVSEDGWDEKKQSKTLADPKFHCFLGKFQINQASF